MKVKFIYKGLFTDMNTHSTANQNEKKKIAIIAKVYNKNKIQIIVIQVKTQN